MTVASGFIRSDSDRLVGTFNIDGSPHHLSIIFDNLGPEFTCSSATLTYNNLEGLVKPGTWSGSIGKTDLSLTTSEDATLTGQLDAPRPSCSRVRGSGMWNTGAESASLLDPTDETQGSVINPSSNQYQPLDAVEDRDKLERERHLLESKAPIIAIFGQSGAGKSTFINLISSQKQEVSNGLQSCTSQISVLGARVGDIPVVVFDTPGIDDTRPGVTEADFLVAMTSRLKAMELQGIKLTGVLFLHRITDNKFSPTARHIASMLEKFCGERAMSHFMLCATMWDLVSPDDRDNRFEELCKTDPWKYMIASGASTAVTSNTGPKAKADAERVIGELIKNVQPVELAIQDEMTVQGKTLVQTGAGSLLAERLCNDQKEAERKMQEEAEIVLRETATSSKKAEEPTDAPECEVERLQELTEEQNRASQDNTERPQQDQEKAENDMEEIPTNDKTDSEKSSEGIHVREVGVDMRGRAEQQTRAGRQTGPEVLGCDVGRMRGNASAESRTSSARVQETGPRLQLAINEFKRQRNILIQDIFPHPWWVYAGGAVVGTVAVGCGILLSGPAAGGAAVGTARVVGVVAAVAVVNLARGARKNTD